ncbi:MAG: hypothetical protein LBH20_05390, partial [Treponema sp.]|nr:hypothetical protein [Treponema sp.]
MTKIMLRKLKVMWALPLVILWGCTAPGTGPTNSSVTFKTLGQNGSASAQTTALTLTFDADITGLAASNITLSAG